MYSELRPDLEESARILDAFTRERFAMFQNKKKPVDSKLDAYLSRTIQQMATDRRLHEGPEHEFFTETARARGESLDPHRIIFPLTCLGNNRALNAAQAVSGGYLLGTDLGQAVHLLKPWSVVLNAGVQVEEALKGNLTIPKTVDGVEIVWQSTETSEATPDTPQIGELAMVPHVGLAVIHASRNFVVQANPEQWIRREMLRAAGVGIDTAVLIGSGASGQPLGVLNTPGISTQAGATLTWTHCVGMKKNAALADVADAHIAFLADPTTRALLEAREKSTTGAGNFIWSDDKIASCPAYASTLVPAASMLCGPMSGISLGLWSDIRIEVNPFDPTLFKRGAIAIRVLVAVDCGITVPLNAFTLASSIT
jgi:HK97 family phage major capsid protein